MSKEEHALRSGGAGALRVWRREADRRGDDVVSALAAVVCPDEVSDLLNKLQDETAARLREEKRLDSLISELPPDWQDRYRYDVVASFILEQDEAGECWWQPPKLGAVGVVHRVSDGARFDVFYWTMDRGYLNQKWFPIYLMNICVEMAVVDGCGLLGYDRLGHQAHMTESGGGRVLITITQPDNWIVEAGFDAPEGWAESLPVSYLQIRELTVQALLSGRHSMRVLEPPRPAMRMRARMIRRQNDPAP